MKHYICWYEDAFGEYQILEFKNSIDAEIHAELTDKNYYEYQDNIMDAKELDIQRAVNGYLSKKNKHIVIG